jgi:hypothetical protein
MFKMILRITLVVLMVPFFHYVLPQKDVARITGTEVIRQDFSNVNRIFYAQAESGNVENPTRDVLFINTVRKQTYLFGLIRAGEANDIMIYRNEDTGWIWPPYFKFDSRDLQGEAQEYTSTAADPQWVIINHYGWRNRLLTIFPNAISIKPIEDPNIRIIPWFNIVFFVAFVAFILFLRAAWYQFRERNLDPALDQAGDRWDQVEANVAERRGRVRRWLDTWRKK